MLTPWGGGLGAKGKSGGNRKSSRLEGKTRSWGSTIQGKKRGTPLLKRKDTEERKGFLLKFYMRKGKFWEGKGGGISRPIKSSEKLASRRHKKRIKKRKVLGLCGKKAQLV